MKYRVLSYSFMLVFAAACTTEQANENDQVITTAPRMEETERSRDLIESLGDANKQRPAEPQVLDSVIVVAGQQQRTDGPVEAVIPRANSEIKSDENDQSVVKAQRESIAKHSQADTGQRPQSGAEKRGNDLDGFTQHLPSTTASIVARQEQIRRASEPLYREQYQRPEDHRVIRVTDNPVSTFSIDVDTGAYSNMRRWLNQGQLPPEDAVRIEEFINYFDYDYPAPRNTNTPFMVETEIAPTPWNYKTHLLRVGIQGYEVPKENMPCSNLVFLIDVSGSMRSPDKLTLLKQALGLMVQNLSANDTISMVVYAGASGVVLPPTRGNQKAKILSALHQLEAGGSTNGGAGLQLAYQMAQQSYQPNGVNRVILATDGDFNVGQSSTTELIDMIQRKRKAGIALTTLGFGSGNYNDHMLEQLADEGNGNHAYIDRLSEARKVLSDELSSTLVTIAKDVKIQIEFNPSEVSEYRLIGYENRILNEEDFNNDKVDAGEIGAGHRVTAIYEISLAGAAYQRLPDRRYSTNRNNDRAYVAPRHSNRELAHLRIRYKQPKQDHSQLIEAPIMASTVLSKTSQASDNFRFAAAVAAFGQKLRGGQYLESLDYSNIAELANKARGRDTFGYRNEFVQLVSLAEMLDTNNPVANTGRLQD